MVQFMGNQSCENFCHRNSIMVKGLEKSDAVKGQASFLVEVKSQSKYLAGQKFDRGRRLEFRIY